MFKPTKNQTIDLLFGLALIVAGVLIQFASMPYIAASTTTGEFVFRTMIALVISVFLMAVGTSFMFVSYTDRNVDKLEQRVKKLEEKT